METIVDSYHAQLRTNRCPVNPWVHLRHSGIELHSTTRPYKARLPVQHGPTCFATHPIDRTSEAASINSNRGARNEKPYPSAIPVEIREREYSLRSKTYEHRGQLAPAGQDRAAVKFLEHRESKTHYGRRRGTEPTSTLSNARTRVVVKAKIRSLSSRMELMSGWTTCRLPYSPWQLAIASVQ